MCNCDVLLSLKLNNQKICRIINAYFSTLSTFSKNFVLKNALPSYRQSFLAIVYALQVLKLWNVVISVKLPRLLNST